ncbi:branched-chain amino acid ABC transporter [Paramesorhizobium deserti]|uniref:Branched-chain amino acid ABC transporter n=1 Tax=Paramesorhizobium deserti TaxID=1494590 RepID=A0A135HNA3_9HYPH|nr:branched-chain amino acid ABC transporter permease [Paramesorhizobium deserti]KXF74692.1 branched-chain amino acid ABC transporter [Paramesorhizobium deserti]
MGLSASPAAPGAAAAAAFTILSQLCGAAFLYVLLKADGSWQVMGLLALLGVGFFLLERFPGIGEFITASLTRVPLVTAATAAIIVLGFPFVVGSNTYILHLLIVAQLYAVLALALNFQLGSANIPNFATGASYGIGAYVSALLALNFGMSFWLTLPIAALAATLFGFIIGIPSMRTRDTYLALVTIAFGVVVQQLLNNFDWTGGPNGLVGIPAPSLFGHSFASPLQVFGWKLPSQANFYYLAAALVVVAVVTAQRLHGSRIGLAWNALRADEIAAKAQGINVAWYKVLAFAVDAFLAAFAGTIYAFYVSYISPDNFTFLVSVTIMTMVIVGGMDNIFGVIVGAFLLTILPEKLRAFSDYRLLFFGVVVIGFLMIRPQGLFPQRLRQYGVHR